MLGITRPTNCWGALRRAPRLASRNGYARDALNDGDINCPTQIAVRSQPAKFGAIAWLQFGFPGMRHWGVLVKRPRAAEEFPDDDPNGLLNQIQAAKRLGIASVTFRRWRNSADYPSNLEVRVGGRTKYRRVVIDRLRQGFPPSDQKR